MAYHLTWKALHTKCDKHHFYFWNLSKYKHTEKKVEGHGILCPPRLKKWGDTSSVLPTKLRPYSYSNVFSWNCVCFWSNIYSYVVEIETWLKLRDRDPDRDFIKESESETRLLRIYGFCWNFCKNFQKVSAPLSSWIFFKFLAFFWPACVVSYQKMEQTQKHIELQKFAKPYRCSWQSHIVAYIESLKAIGLWLRPVASETETRPETFETETRINVSRDESRDRDQVSGLHHSACTRSRSNQRFILWKNHWWFVSFVVKDVSKTLSSRTSKFLAQESHSQRYSNSRQVITKLIVFEWKWKSILLASMFYRLISYLCKQPS